MKGRREQIVKSAETKIEKEIGLQFFLKFCLKTPGLFFCYSWKIPFKVFSAWKILGPGREKMSSSTKKILLFCTALIFCHPRRAFISFSVKADFSAMIIKSGLEEIIASSLTVGYGFSIFEKIFFPPASSIRLFIKDLFPALINGVAQIS